MQKILAVGRREDKLKAVRNFEPPCNVKKIREFAGLCNYFRFLIKDFALLAGKLTMLTKKSSNWKGGELPEESKAAFMELKSRLCEAPVVAFPRRDLDFILAMDGSLGDSRNPGGLGACLTQIDEHGIERVVAYASRTLKKHENNRRT